MNPLEKMPRARIASPMLSGLLYTFIWMIAGTLVASLLLLFTGMQENRLSTYSLVIHGLAILIGGLVSGKRAQSKGWYHGGILGLIYSVIVVMIGFLAFDAGFQKETAVLITLCFLLGALGGMFGVNLKK
jgi:putative membrane protein (TIGR04086 family)